jgi:2-dehydropantoate 2-reductase
MRVIIYGAGGVGGTIGARLHLLGADVILIARGAHLEALQTEGLKFVTVEGEHQLAIPVVGHPQDLDWQEGDVVLLTMKSQHTSAALDALGESASRRIPMVCGQNGVANERMALRRFTNVYAMVVNLPAVHLQPGEVVTHAEGSGGILDTGRYPDGCDALVETLTGLLRDAGFTAAPDRRIMRKKYAKLLMNLGNIVQAATVPATEGATVPAEGAQEHEALEKKAVAEIYRCLRGEALECFEAAGIECASREEVRERHQNTYRMTEIPGRERAGGSSWQSFSRGTGNVETDYLNGEIALLGGLHGVPTPGNRVCLEIASKMLRERLDVGSFRPSEILAMINTWS